MARVLSYDHRDGPYQNARKEITIPLETLEPYVGLYEAPKSGALTVALSNNLLILALGGDKTFVFHPESETAFFITKRDLTFEFVKTGTKVSKIVVREHGAIVEEASRSK